MVYFGTKKKQSIILQPPLFALPLQNLRSFDQYSNMVLDNASERRFHDENKDDDNEEENTPTTPKVTYFTDVPLGMYIVRGDSIVLLGQVGDDEDETNNPNNSTVVMKRLDNDAFEDLVSPDDDEEEDEENGDKLEWDFDKDLLA